MNGSGDLVFGVYAGSAAGTDTADLATGPADDHRREVSDLGGAAFRRAVDFVGVDLFPDVFVPVSRPDLAAAVTA